MRNPYFGQAAADSHLISGTCPCTEIKTRQSTLQPAVGLFDFNIPNIRHTSTNKFLSDPVIRPRSCRESWIICRITYNPAKANRRLGVVPRLTTCSQIKVRIHTRPNEGLFLLIHVLILLLNRVILNIILLRLTSLPTIYCRVRPSLYLQA
jgi:hypothetical protein